MVLWKDTVQWIIDSRKNVTAQEVAQQTLAYIFASAYQMPMVRLPKYIFGEAGLTGSQLITFALYNLSKHPEYLQPLRAEILRSGGVLLNHQNNELPMLDSFLKETARLNPVTICMIPQNLERHSIGFPDALD
jgi:hypothetical protein